MSRDGDPQLDAFAVDVRDLLDRSIANLYSHLVTRPTGRAVRMAIEAQLRELESPALSLVDFSSVSVLDYSCADEVVARLLLERRGDVFFLFQGLREHHTEPIDEVLVRHELAAVGRRRGEAEFELLGVRSRGEEEVWHRVEREGRIPRALLTDVLPGSELQRVADGLARRGLIFQHPMRGDLHALSTLVRGRA